MANYNPAEHKSIVDNIRDAYSEKYGQSITELTDKEVWDVLDLIPDQNTALRLLQRLLYTKMGYELPLDE